MTLTRLYCMEVMLGFMYASISTSSKSDSKVALSICFADSDYAQTHEQLAENLMISRLIQVLCASGHAWPISLFIVIREEPYMFREATRLSLATMLFVVPVVAFLYLGPLQPLLRVRRSNGELCCRTIICVVGYFASLVLLSTETSIRMPTLSAVCVPIAMSALLATVASVFADFARLSWSGRKGVSRRCRSCAYPLVGLESTTTCPECGNTLL
jgi:hypothetical protein